jgi:4-amino-4-deoxy-L-arabinose transferase-like glycosyltransferase
MPSREFVGALGLGVVALYAAILGAMRFHLCLNDYWAWSFFASRLDFADPETLYNGFMPPAYAVFLKLAGPRLEVAAAFALTLLAVFVTVSVVANAAGRIAGRSAGLVAVLFVAGWAPFLESGLTAGPDIVVAGLIAVAAWCLWLHPLSAGARVLAAFALAIAILTRGHALLAGIALLAAPVLYERRWTRSTSVVAAGLLIGVLAQVALNLAAGQGAWSSAQAFNVYKMVHGMDWYAPVVPEGLSVLGVFRDAPVEFLRGWAGATVRAGVWLLGPAFAWWYARREADPELQRFSALAVLAGLVYLVPVSLGDSPRAVVVLSGVVIPPVAVLFVRLRRASTSVPRLAGVLIVAMAVAISFRADRAFLAHNFGQARDFAAVEEALAALGPVQARQVFTEDFDLYFRGLEGQRPLTKGGWGLVGIEGWSDEFPQLDTSNRAGFLESCAAHDVRYLALTRRSRRLGQEFSRFYYDPTAAGLSVLGEYGEFVLLELPSSVRDNEEARP